MTAGVDTGSNGVVDAETTADTHLSNDVSNNRATVDVSSNKTQLVNRPFPALFGLASNLLK